MEQILLQVNKVSVGNKEGLQENKITHEVSFSLKKGEILGIVGESGSGKSLTSLAIMDLLPENLHVHDGEILFLGEDLLKKTKKEKQQIRGKTLSMIFQEPMTSLNPLMKIGKQVEESIRIHEKKNKKECKELAWNGLKEVGLENLDVVYDQYPHELSGGMRQRVMIAMAMIEKPQLLIADEPTTALDVTIQIQILDLLKQLNEKHNTSIILISHDMGVIRYLCNRAVVMEKGIVVESATTEQLFANPKEEYTKKLLASVEALRKENAKENLMQQKEEEKEEIEEEAVMEETVVSIKELSVFYREKNKSIFSKKAYRKIVDKVTFEVKKGHIFGIVGESGSGKSTLLKAIAGFAQKVDGTIDLFGEKPQMVFQDPYTSLNPAKKVGWILEEPLRMQSKLKSKERKEKVEQILQKVGLNQEVYERYIKSLSGGQRQRVAIAHALITQQRLILLDEPVSALDVTIQLQILNLLKSLREEFQLSYIFVSHDLGVVQQLCDYVIVMKDGVIVEQGNPNKIFNSSQNSYTKKLVASVL